MNVVGDVGGRIAIIVVSSCSLLLNFSNLSHFVRFLSCQYYFSDSNISSMKDHEYPLQDLANDQKCSLTGR